MELLCAVLVSLKDTPLDSLSKERRLEWRGWCKILCRQSSAFPSCWSTFGQQLMLFFRGRLPRTLMLRLLLLKKLQLVLKRCCKTLRPRSSRPFLPQLLPLPLQFLRRFIVGQSHALVFFVAQINMFILTRMHHECPKYHKILENDQNAPKTTITTREHLK